MLPKLALAEVCSMTNGLFVTKTSGRECRTWNQFHDQPVSPAILAAREFLNDPNPLKIGLLGKNSRPRSEDFFTYSNLHPGIGTQVLNPMRGLVLCNYVESSVMLREPDFDLAIKPRFSSSGRQIEELRRLQTTGLST